MFPLIKTIGALTFVDDDDGLLQAVRIGIRDPVVHTFSDLEAARLHIQASTAFLGEQRVLIKDIVTADTHTQRVEAARALLSDPKHLQMSEVVYVDYTMPRMTGLQFLKSVDCGDMKRVLMTGAADESIVEGARQRAEVHSHVDKGRPNLVRTIRETSIRLDESVNALLRKNLSADFLANLTQGPQNLSAAMSVANVLEYVAVSGPDGFVCKTKDNSFVWIQPSKEGPTEWSVEKLSV